MTSALSRRMISTCSSAHWSRLDSAHDGRGFPHEAAVLRPGHRRDLLHPNAGPPRARTCDSPSRSRTRTAYAHASPLTSFSPCASLGATQSWCVSPIEFNVAPDPGYEVYRTRPYPSSWRRYKWHMTMCGSTIPDSSYDRGEEDTPKVMEKTSRKKTSAQYRRTACWSARHSHSCKCSMHKRASCACASRSSSRPPLLDGVQRKQQVQLTHSNLFTLELGLLRSVIAHFVD